MDLITMLPHISKGHDAIWVVINRLTKSAHFIPTREDLSADKLAPRYVGPFKLLKELERLPID